MASALVAAVRATPTSMARPPMPPDEAAPPPRMPRMDCPDQSPSPNTSSMTVAPTCDTLVRIRLAADAVK
jgi:hypothetical protein